MKKKNPVPKGFVPFNTMPKEKALELNRKGGLSKSVKKVTGAKLRHLKERLRREGITDVNAQSLLEKIECREVHGADIIVFLESLKKRPDLSFNESLNLVNTMIKVGVFIHGEKKQIEAKNLTANVDVDLIAEEAEAHLNKILGRNKEEKQEDE